MKKIKLLAPIIALVVLSGCAAEPEPEPTPTVAEEVIERPDYGSDGKPFTINGKGSGEIGIDFPGGLDAISILSLSATGAVTIQELNYDGNRVGSAIPLRGEGTTVVVKYPTEDTPARTNRFYVDAKDDVAWALSAESVSSLQRVGSLSISGTGTKAFIFDNEANTLHLVTTGLGDTDVYVVTLQTNSAQKIAGGSNTQSARTDASTVRLDNFAGYAFVVVPRNPETQFWELMFSTTPDN